MNTDIIHIYGMHALKEALKNAPHCVEEVYLSPHANDPELRKLISQTKVAVSPFAATDTREVDEAVHQGVIGVVSLRKVLIPYDKFKEKLEVTPNAGLILLGEIQDPQNVGAIIRSAAAFGISGVLIPEHNQAPITGSVVKVSAGMAFKVPLVTIGNVNTTLRNLKDKGFWIYGLEGEGSNPLDKEVFDAPAVFVLGNESEGIREKTKETCDILLSIPIDPQCESLNVAASAAVTLYAWTTGRTKK